MCTQYAPSLRARIPKCTISSKLLLDHANLLLDIANLLLGDANIMTGDANLMACFPHGDAYVTMTNNPYVMPSYTR